MIVRATYTVRDGNFAEWVWDCSPISSDLTTFTPNTLEVNRQLMASINDEIWNQGKLELIDERYAEDDVRHGTLAIRQNCRAAWVKQFIQAVRGGFPDRNCAIEEMFAVGDKVVVRYRCRTHTGEWDGWRRAIASSSPTRSFTGSPMARWWKIGRIRLVGGRMQQSASQLTPPQATSAGCSPTCW